MSDLVGNPKDRFSHNEAQITVHNISKFSNSLTWLKIIVKFHFLISYLQNTLFNVPPHTIVWGNGQSTSRMDFGRGIPIFCGLFQHVKFNLVEPTYPMRTK